MQTKTYSTRTVWIHWLSALLIGGLIFTGISMENEALNAQKFLLYKVHFALGILVFLLTLIRVVALIKDPKPAPLYPSTSFRERFKNLVSKSFYPKIPFFPKRKQNRHGKHRNHL